MYTIRLDVEKFSASKDHRKLLKRMNGFLSGADSNCAADCALPLRVGAARRTMHTLRCNETFCLLACRRARAVEHGGRS